MSERQDYIRRGSRRRREMPDSYDDIYEEGSYEEDYEEPYEEEDSESTEETEEHEKPKRRRRSAFPLFVFLIVLLITVIAGSVGYYMMQRPERKLPGVWRMEIDCSERVIAEAEGWLSAAESGDQISVKDKLGEIKIDVILMINADGTWSRSVDAASYAAAQEASYAALSDALRELLLLRIEAAGREAGSAEEAEALIANTIGMSTQEYLKGYGPTLLPSEEELRSLYDGSGGYEAKGNLLTIEADAEEYLVSGEMLVITGAEETSVYHRVTGTP